MLSKILKCKSLIYVALFSFSMMACSRSQISSKPKKESKWAAIVEVVTGVLGAIMVSGCGGSSSGNVSITGRVQQGPVEGATVQAYKIEPDGDRGEKYGDPVTTNSNGEYTLSAAPYTGGLEVVATGGIYEDEGTGLPISRGTSEISTMVSEFTPAGIGEAGGIYPVTALTSAAFGRFQESVQDGVSFASLRDAVWGEMETAYGITNIDLMPQHPEQSDSDPNDEASQYMKVLAGFSDAAKDLGVTPDQYLVAFTYDFQDGDFDGKAGSASVSLSGYGTNPVAAINQGMSDWITAAASRGDLPPGTDSSTYNYSMTFIAAPPVLIDDCTGYSQYEDKWDADYNPKMNPYDTNYVAGSDPCMQNADGSYATPHLCPMAGSSFNSSAYNTEYAGATGYTPPSYTSYTSTEVPNYTGTTPTCPTGYSGTYPNCTMN